MTSFPNNHYWAYTFLNPWALRFMFYCFLPGKQIMSSIEDKTWRLEDKTVGKLDGTLVADPPQGISTIRQNTPIHHLYCRNFCTDNANLWPWTLPLVANHLLEFVWIFFSCPKLVKINFFNAWSFFKTLYKSQWVQTI